MKKLTTMMLAVWAAGAALGASTAHLALDNRTGTRTAEATEEIRLSPAWETDEPGATATVSLDGVAVASSSTEDAFAWTPSRDGTYTFTHAVRVGGSPVGETLTATFVVEGVAPSSYTVTLDANGGDCPVCSRDFLYGASYGDLPEPEREGYTFLGWYTSEEGGDLVGPDWIVLSDADLYAHWRANTYTVRFSANGGVGTMTDESFTYGTAKALTANAFTREGYTFQGWATSASGSKVYSNQQSVSNLTATANSTVNLYAVWTANYMVTVTGGTGSGSYASGTLVTVTANAPETGYTFAGWTGTGTAYLSNTNSTTAMLTVPAQNVSLTATYAKDDEGSELGGVQLWEGGPYWATCNVGANQPEESGYYFWWGDTVGYTRNASSNGWVSVANGASFSFSSSTCPTYGKTTSQLQSAGYLDSTGNLVAAHDAATAHLGAPWRMPTDAEFAALISNCDTTWTTRNGVCGRLVTGRGAYSSRSIFLPAAGIGEGSTFGKRGSYGYYRSSTPYSDPDTAWYLIFTSSDFYRIFTSSVFYLDYKFRGDGLSVRPLRDFSGNGQATLFHVTVMGGTGSGSYASGTLVTVTANAPETGYKFAGWTGAGAAYLSNTNSTTATLTVPAQSVTLTATYQPNTYSVKFNANGGTGTMSNESFTYGTAKALTANAFTRTGYTFQGWATSASGSKVYSNQQSVSNLTATANGTVNLYAVWTANTYSVKFNANGGTGTMSNESFTYGTAKALTANAFTRTGYTFQGWASTADGAVMYANGSSVKNLASAHGSVVTLYAVWEPVETQTTSVPVPHAWIRRYFPNVSDYEAKAKSKCANGVNTVEEAYVAGFNPTDPQGKLVASVAISNGMVCVSWEPNLNTGVLTRIYKVFGRTCFEKGEWETSAKAWHRFFKVLVTMPTGALGEKSAVAGDGFVPEDEPQLGGVQLWENGPYWAECNVGATKPEEYGYYFWWGDTVGYKRNANNDGWVSVTNGAQFSFSTGNCPTYITTTSQLQSAGYVDASGNLVAEHDAATAHLGAPWRMPTDEEFFALINNCDTEWTMRNGVYGRLVKGKGEYSSKSIFLPAAGSGFDSYLCYLGSDGYYWSSTPDSGDSGYAWFLSFYSGYFNRLDIGRWVGQSVRPVRGFAK